jgi:RNA polymerase sigma factor (sigma-70 family)
MEMTPDHELLRQFARTNSEDAFAELVKRHVNLVYSAAFRQVNGDDHLARDIAQTVFTDLARKAGSLARRENLAGWLYTSAHFAAAKVVRGENRRRDREEKFMREPTNETAPDADWEKIRPTLDNAMHELKESDRAAILLRYFENRQFAEVGAKLGLNENAARMRVDRALEKLRAVFAKRGITTATTLASVISVNAIQMAPANLAATLTATSLATVGTGTFTLLKIMTATKIKLGISTVLVASAATALVLQHQAQEKLRGENEALQQQIVQLQTDNASLSNQLANAGGSSKLTDDQFNELLKLRGEVGVLKRQTNELGELENENRRLREQMNAAQNPAISKEQEKEQAIQKLNDAKGYVLGFILYANDHNGQFPSNWDQISAYTNKLQNVSGTNDFEIVNQGAINEYAIGTNGNSIILIKSPAWLSSEGKWVKTYGFVDGHAQINREPPEGFDAYEQQHMVAPPNQ